jgi:hypothetical protein
VSKGSDRVSLTTIELNARERATEEIGIRIFLCDDKGLRGGLWGERGLLPRDDRANRIVFKDLREDLWELCGLRRRRESIGSGGGGGDMRRLQCLCLTVWLQKVIPSSIIKGSVFLSWGRVRGCVLRVRAVIRTLVLETEGRRLGRRGFFIFVTSFCDGQEVRGDTSQCRERRRDGKREGSKDVILRRW